MVAEATRRPGVVVVGGGPAGLAACQALVKDAKVTLIEPKGYYEINWASLRAMVEPSFVDSVIVPYSKIPNAGTIVTAHAHSFTDSAVVTDQGQTIPYDYLVLATGSSYPSPIKESSGTLADRQQTYKDGYEELKAATSILIIGGGPVGVELAGEIAEEMPDKKVTVVTSAARLIADKRPRVGALSLAHLQNKGVKVIFDHKAEKQSDGSYMVGSQRLTATLTFATVGVKPNTSFLASSFPLTDKGLVQVDDALRVKGRKRVYCIGDCNDVNETKLGFLAVAQAAVVATNIRADIKAEASGGKALMKPYTVFMGGPEIMLLSLGRNNGVMQVGPLVIGGFVPKYIKCGDMLAGKTRKQLGIID